MRGHGRNVQCACLQNDLIKIDSFHIIATEQVGLTVTLYIWGGVWFESIPGHRTENFFGTFLSSSK
jgi:hypothetical protein